MPKTNLTVYLAKRGQKPEDIVLGVAPDKNDGRHRSAPKSIAIKGIGTLYYRQSDPHKPSWATDFFDDEVVDVMFSAASVSAVLVLEVSDRLFAITFGYGRHLLDLGSMEERFGLRVVLNSCEDLSFRKISSTSVAGNAGKTSEQLPRLSKLTDFSIDSVMDTLDKVVAKVKDDDLFEGTISGGDALGFSCDEGVRGIKHVLEGVLDRYSSVAYIDRYPWVDNVLPVKDTVLTARLEAKAIDLINAHDECIWTAPPDLIEDWNRIDHFRIDGRLGVRFDDIMIEDVLQSYSNGLNTFNQLRSKRIRAIDSHDGMTPLYSWRVSDCLFGECILDGDNFCINAGKWYLISHDYAEDVNQRYKKALLYETNNLPECGKDERESDYNRKLAASDESFLLMDAKTISYGLSHSSIELCDVLAGNETFLHVKQYSGSSTLSHLFSQGYNSAYLVNSDSNFVAKANERIREQPGAGGHEIRQGLVSCVVFVIICKQPAQPPNIPFFSRITYNEMANRLKTMGVESRICAIRKTVDGSC